jgi:hypothetical protein
MKLLASVSFFIASVMLFFFFPQFLESDFPRPLFGGIVCFVLPSSSLYIAGGFIFLRDLKIVSIKINKSDSIRILFLSLASPSALSAFLGFFLFQYNSIVAVSALLISAASLLFLIILYETLLV